ncbi:Uncharacterised protein [Clostridium putrefaciens]|uniref:Uncharacterized protein n=1 Tax=Clostridium putrefaciens TaxID=99675 RepID=A0A381J9M8_9CLOT|nr:Uncharacterised protein [Clostridium putrefaciens]SUY47129.1 Uncharacterised protein [Clostridium putrefaciens]
MYNVSLNENGLTFKEIEKKFIRWFVMKTAVF